MTRLRPLRAVKPFERLACQFVRRQSSGFGVAVVANEPLRDLDGFLSRNVWNFTPRVSHKVARQEWQEESTADEVPHNPETVRKWS